MSGAVTFYLNDEIFSLINMKMLFQKASQYLPHVEVVFVAFYWVKTLARL